MSSASCRRRRWWTVAKAVLTIHRDFGDRSDRKHARLKYVLQDRGAQWFREELERRVGFRLGEPMPFKFEKQGDAFGWSRQADGRLFLGLFVETGRIKDRDGWRMKTALREVVARYPAGSPPHAGQQRHPGQPGRRAAGGNHPPVCRTRDTD